MRVFSIAESEKSEGVDKTVDVEVENPDDSQFFNVASKVLKKFDSKPKTGDANKSLPTATTKVFKSPKAKMPLQIVVSRFLV